ncbi:putative FAD dependent oxidoreductase [Stachybotrys elegans]|uniref:FAD dependent oxidoreductase n=1 Tax=Stachybotrys elegans TaxID=80388 RepID=A0A8K0STC5_9HYPO|nr:putative FAD dependent oxidoreductase [Stachybotrys elegans]
MDAASLDLPVNNRREPGSAAVPPAPLPTDSLPDNVDPGQVADDIIARIGECIASCNSKGFCHLFLGDGFLKDHLCLSWDLRTLADRDNIEKYLAQNMKHLESISIDRSAPHRAPAIHQLDVHGKSKVVGFFTSVVTKVGTGQGYIRMVYRDDVWKIFALYMALRELKGFEEPGGIRRPKGTEHGDTLEADNCRRARNFDSLYKGKDPAILIVGAGQGGLILAARLKILGIDTLVIDPNPRVGDNWRQRQYRQLVLHTPVWFDHMPYMPFPDDWPVFASKDKLADWFEMYADLLELNVWTKMALRSASWDGSTKTWTATVGDGAIVRTLRPRHIVQATGHSGVPNIPAIQGMDSFKGKIGHSSCFRGAQPTQGKRAIVVGSCNSGHDIARDFYENGYHVTMAQRSSTCIISSECMANISLAALYSEGSPPHGDSDLILWSMPAAVHKSQQIQLTEVTVQRDRATLEGLKRAGFKVDVGIDKAGLFFKYFQHGGGYYIDVGCSQLIIDGKIGIKQGQEISKVLPDGLLFADGSKIEADEIVFATGYQNMRSQARRMTSPQVADRLNDAWGLDEEGEWRGMWRRSGHPGYWYMGGSLALARYYSRCLALQIKAVEEGLAPYE